MILNRSMVYIALAISSLLFSAVSDSKLIACAGGDEDVDDYFYTFFDDQNSGVESSFFLNAGIISPEINYSFQNAQEWKTYLGDRDSTGKRNWEYFIHSTSAETFAHLVKKVPAENDLPAEALACVPYITQTKYKSALEYLLFSKEIEQYTSFYYAWYEDRPEPSAELSAVITKAKKLYKSASDPFLRQRYGFQVQRLLYQNLQFQESIDLYKNELVKLSTSPSISERSAGYYSAAYYALKDYTTANLLYARQYRDGINKNSAVWSFHVQDETEWEQTLKKAESRDDLVALWFMMGYYNDPLRAMEAIYPIAPNCNELAVLMTRAINSEEHYIIDQNKKTDNSYWDSYAKVYFDTAVSGEPLYQFAVKLASEKKASNLSFWQISAGHLAYLKNDSEKCKEWLAKAAANTPSEAQSIQIKLTTLLNDLRNNKLDKAGEEQLIPDIQWLQKKAEKEYEGKSRQAIRYVFTTLVKRFSELKKPVYAELCARQSEWTSSYGSTFYTSELLTQQMLDLLRSKTQTPWEKLLIKGYQLNERDVVDWQTIQLLYKDDLEAAAKKSNEPGKANVENLYGDPFVIHIRDCHDCDHANGNFAEWDKSLLIEKMLELKGKIGRNEEVAQNAYKLANAYYNITYYGNARKMYFSAIADGQRIERYYWDDADTVVRAVNVYNMANCKKYYALAYKYEQNRERKAELCWMLAKCELNDYYNRDVQIPERLKKEEKIDFVLGPHSHEFAMNYKDTKYYKEVLKQCGYFRKIVR